MLQRISTQVQECLGFAADAHARAAAATNLSMSAFHLQMEHSWTRLAESFAHAERLNRFLKVQQTFSSDCCWRCNGPLRLASAEADAGTLVCTFQCTRCDHEQLGGAPLLPLRLP